MKKNVACILLATIALLFLGCPNPASNSTDVTLSGLSANGTAGSVTTSALTLTFSADPTSLAASDITLTGATKGALSGTGITRNLEISAITVGDGANVTVALANPAGFTITPASKTVSVNVASVPVTFSGLTANGTTGTASTTILTLTFSADPTSLAASDITLTGATKGALSGTGTTRSLAISAITVADGASVTVALANPAGFTITPASKAVAVVVAGSPVTFSGLTANGTSGTISTTILTLTFSADPTSLAASDITLTGATKGALSGTGTTRSLAISAITVANGANVTVALANPAGFAITPLSKTVAVNVANVPMSFSSLTANGTSGTVSTTILTLTFSADPTSLAASNITLTGATKGALSGTGTTRSLAISAITVANGANVTVALANPAGFAITPLSRTVAVNVATVPDAPTGLTAVADPILAKVVLTWTSPSGTVTGYKIYSYFSSGSETLETTLTGSASTYTSTAWNNYTGSLYYKVSALNSVGESVLSGEAIATTAAPSIPTLQGYSEGAAGPWFDASVIYVWLTPPSNYDSSDPGAIEYTMHDPFSWTTVKTTNLTGVYFYYIKNYTSQTQGANTLIRGSTSTTTDYTFTVRVKNQWGWSVPSDILTVTLPKTFPLVNVTSIAVGSQSLTPSWAQTSTDTNATVRLLCVDFTAETVTDAGAWDIYNKTSCTVTGLNSSHSYGFFVQTYNSHDHNGASSEQVSPDNEIAPYTVEKLYQFPTTVAKPNP